MGEAVARCWGAPHALQNFVPSGSCVPQLWQYIGSHSQQGSNALPARIPIALEPGEIACRGVQAAVPEQGAYILNTRPGFAPQLCRRVPKYMRGHAGEPGFLG